MNKKYKFDALNVGNIQLPENAIKHPVGGMGGDLGLTDLSRPIPSIFPAARTMVADTLLEAGIASGNKPETPSVKKHPDGPMPKCPGPGAGVHSWIMAAAWWCKHSGLILVDAEAAISKALTRSPRPGEISEALGKAYNAEPDAKFSRALQAKFAPEKLKAIAAKVGSFTEADLALKSPIDPRLCSAADFLRALYKVGERVLILTSCVDSSPAVWEHQTSDAPQDLDQYKMPAEGQGVWFLSNPVTGDVHKVSRLVNEKNPEGETMRAAEAATTFRYMMVESDEAPTYLWLSAIVQVPLPIVSLVTSGGKSLHALILIDAASEAEFNEIKAQIGPALVKMGACRNSLTPVRLTRLPGCYRAEKGAWQRLLYLNPEADGTPIFEMPDLRPQESACASSTEGRHSDES